MGSASAPSVLLVSIGNSRTACARLDRDAPLSGVIRFPAAVMDPLHDFPPGGTVHLVSVVAERARDVAAACRAAGREVVWWGMDREIPVRHPYAAPAKPGPDRLVAAFAAFQRAGGSSVIVDAGTAVTVDVVGKDGSFLGGAIAPGFATLAEGLRAKAPALPDADRKPPAAYPGRSTADAVNIGIHAAFAAPLRELVDRAFEVAGSVPLFVTGGDADMAALALEARAPVIVPELVLEGLAALARSLR